MCDITDRNSFVANLEPMVRQIIYKYSKRVNDDDLFQDCMLKACECVDDCYLKGIVEESEIKARCYAWVRNKTIDTLKRYSPELKDEEYWLRVESRKDTQWAIAESSACMDEQMRAVFTLLVSGRTGEEIVKSMGIGKTKYKAIVKQIKEILNER